MLLPFQPPAHGIYHLPAREEKLHTPSQEHCLLSSNKAFLVFLPPGYLILTSQQQQEETPGFHIKEFWGCVFYCGRKVMEGGEK